jgi:hypothetical protein
MLGTVLKRWNWLEDGLIPLAATLMYAAWAYPLFALFLQDSATGARNSGFTFLLCVGILLGGFVAGRLAKQNRLGVVIVIIGGFAALVVTMMVVLPEGSEDLGGWLAALGDRVMHGREGEALPLPLVVVACAVLLWWRGLRTASAEEAETVGSFVVGVMALVGLLILTLVLPSTPITALADQTTSTSSVLDMAPLLFVISIPAALAFAVLARFIGPVATALSQGSIAVGFLAMATTLPSGPSRPAMIGWIVVFLGSGLATLALTNLLHTLQEQEAKIGVRLHIDRYWLFTMLSVVTVVLALGLIVGRLVAPASVLQAFAWLRPIWDLLLKVVLIVLYAFAYLFFSLLEPLFGQINQQSGREVTQTFESSVEPQDMVEAGQKLLQIPPIVGYILRALLIAGAIALVAWIFYRATRRRGRGVPAQEDDVVETRETILSADLLRTQIAGLVGSLRRARHVTPFLDPGPAGDRRRIVRELYQGVLAEAIALDAPRPKGQTPTTYQRMLQYLCPNEQASLDVLTGAYTVARYGDLPPSMEQVQAAQSAYERIDAVLRTKIHDDTP